MKTIRIIVRNMQQTDYSAQVPGVVLRPGENDLDILHWLNLRRHLKSQIDGGFVTVNAADEATATESIKQEYFKLFETLGVPTVKVASESGDYCKGALRNFADEWLISKSEDRSTAAIAASLEANSLARDSNDIARSSSREAAKANRRASIALIIAVIGALAAVGQAIAAFKQTPNSSCSSSQTLRSIEP
ncbi:hypothetical protein [Methylophilus sp. 3sh_L]|uniref:hypothetical protein n=1 Tax=Methylophilus sp. 3sh_L TaxID=3377114 RepID=UPI00398F5BAF